MPIRMARAVRDSQTHVSYMKYIMIISTRTLYLGGRVLDDVWDLDSNSYMDTTLGLFSTRHRQQCQPFIGFYLRSKVYKRDLNFPKRLWALS